MAESWGSPEAAFGVVSLWRWRAVRIRWGSTAAQWRHLTAAHGWEAYTPPPRFIGGPWDGLRVPPWMQAEAAAGTTSFSVGAPVAEDQPDGSRAFPPPWGAYTVSHWRWTAEAPDD